jgi:hypothetical protein
MKLLLKRFTLVGVAAALGAVALVMLVGAASATPTSAGTWTLYPAQTDVTTTGTPVTTTAYMTAVRPPINADGSSNFPGKRGVVPVQFDLLAGTKTVTPTTHTVGPVVFESIGSDTNTDNDFSYLSLVPVGAFHFGDLTNLTAGYTFTQGDCHGGSLRWSVRIDANDNGVRDDSDPAVFIYYGALPQFGNGGVNGCTPTSVLGEDSSNHNMLAADRTDDLRFDTGQFAGGTFYDTYANAVALAGAHQVLNTTLVLDSGWQYAPLGDQKVTLGTVTVNDNTFVPKTPGETTTYTTTYGTFAKTCTLPQAAINVTKDDANPDGTQNETVDSVQPKDTGVYFRQVDCKYIYNLDISTLTGKGTYRVYANIGGSRVTADPAKFDILG